MTYMYDVIRKSRVSEHKLSIVYFVKVFYNCCFQYSKFYMYIAQSYIKYSAYIIAIKPH